LIEETDGFCNNTTMNFVDTIEVGTRIRAIREQNNLTLKELAKRTVLDVGQLSRIESNKVGARESTFRRIAAGLGVPAETFNIKRKTAVKKMSCSLMGIRDTGSPPDDLNFDAEELHAIAEHVSEDCTRYHAEGEVAFPVCALHLRPQTSHDYIIARENCRAALQAAQEIEQRAGVVPRALIQLTLPILPTAQGAGLLARHVRTMLGIGDAVCYDYFELLARHGIRTLELQLPDEVGSLSLYESSLNQATIFISSGRASTQNTPERKIYSLVTELANILMENARKASIIERVPAAQLLSDEKFTRHFAAIFLIPAEAVQETMRQYRLTPERWNYDLMLSIKNRFGVSAQAFCYRLLELEHISETLAAEFRTRIEAHYEEVRTNAVTHSRTNALLPFEPSPTDRATRLNAFLCDLIQLMPSGSVNEPDNRAALRMLKKLGCVEIRKGK
jgi:transcriptional regulator with XRE-family HTH domain/Zn-dependent peptidase ImmA (M78 family)